MFGSTTAETPPAMPEHHIDALRRLIYTQPPRRFTSSPVVDRPLANLLFYFMRDFIQAWYEQISPSLDFSDALLDEVAAMVHRLEERCQKVDWTRLVMVDVPDAAVQHLTDFRQCQDKLGTVYANDMEMAELFYNHQPHVALRSREAEIRYLRDTCDAALGLLMEESVYGTEGVRYLLREVLTATLIASIDRLCDSDFLYDLILAVLTATDETLHIERQEGMHKTPAQKEQRDLHIIHGQPPVDSETPVTKTRSVTADSITIIKAEEQKIRKRKSSTPALSKRPMAPLAPSSSLAALNDTQKVANDATTQTTPALPPFLQSILPLWLLQLLQYLTFIVHDTAKGPSQLGPIDVRKHQKERMDESWFSLLFLLLQLPQRHPWLVSQFSSLVRPTCWLVGGRFIHSQDQMTMYIEKINRTMWPAGIWAPSPPIKTPDQRRLTLQATRTKLKAEIPLLLRRILSDGTVDGGIDTLLEMIQYDSLNRHFFYVLVDLTLAHLLPELTDGVE